MNNLQVFNNLQFGELRTLALESQVWFVAIDVCKILEIKNTTQALERLEEDERTMLNIGRQGETNLINEYGLYSLILGSRKKEAKQFKRWVTHEVLPSIRKNGGYITGQETLSEEELIQKALMVATRKLEERERQLEEQKPKVLFADSVETSKTSILIGDLAKLIKQNGQDVGQNRLFHYLRENGYLIKSGERKNMPTQMAMEMKLFEVKERILSNPDGSIRITKTTKVTGKGQVYFVNKFLHIENCNVI